MNESIDCPKCKIEMKPQLVEGIEVDRCPGCQGIWFDMLEHEDLKKMPGSESLDNAVSGKDSSDVVKDCPRCHTRLSPTHDAEQPHIVYDKCSSCYGVFFDAGEFADLKELTLKERLKAWVG
ncbi:zf-TFIIB domain-containing protein [Kiritimatiellota bacterium B12222]|nr:zf-TFIIB domain-containing protein [Kiritimatiellota bacterium B12222]